MTKLLSKQPIVVGGTAEEYWAGGEYRYNSRCKEQRVVLGANDFLTKPLDRAEVVLRVRNLLRARDLYVELMATKQTLERRLASATSSSNY
jgi:response regulator RpfG family c-di-GMP phosphodiesterase